MTTTTTVSLDDRYSFEGKPYYLNGTQALVRLTMLERRRREAAGKNTAVYISGYRGSPLGGFDQALGSAAKHLGPHIVFLPGVNEDLAATAVWGTQQVGTFGEGKYDGVSALWYGKGPGVDRSGDAFKHGNNAGSARDGGVLVVAGDDHSCKSSTLAHQSEFGLVDAMIPVLAPSSAPEIIEFGLIGWEMSRYSGLWVGLKIVTEVMDSGQSVSADPIVEMVEPADFALPPGGLSIRWPDAPLDMENRLHSHKIPAAIAFARANRLDKVVLDSPRARIGIVTVGKSYVDTRQALRDLDIDDARAAALGIRLYKVAMPWPLEPQGAREFADGLEEIVVVEEKRALIEDQLRQHLYGVAKPPRIVGKRDETGAWLFPAPVDLGAGLIAVALAKRIATITGDDAVEARGREIATRLGLLGGIEKLAERPPHFCSGCPHSSSTKVPEGSKAFAGIGCSYMAQSMNRETAGYTQMGGEGANWIGLGPFSKTPHMFQNMGDGTFFHSGSMAIRAAIASGVNVTYKILYNHAVAMTGGQHVDGDLTLARVIEIVAAEGVKEIVVVTDDPKSAVHTDMPAGVKAYHRDDLDEVQRRLREVPGVSVLIYDQSCATELRRLRKRGQAPDPQVAVVINDLVCEGCGDCSVKSNCLSVTPIETEFGRKRAIDQSTCNKDRSCLGGFCPSFVTIEGGKRRKPSAATADFSDLPMPTLPPADEAFSLIVTGIGGTGVVTIGALLGMAAHIEGKQIRVMDMTGLAQKGGAVVSHIQIAPKGQEVRSSRVSVGSADLLLGCDIVVAASADNLGRVSKAKGRIIANDHETVTGEFTRVSTFAVPVRSLRRQLTAAVEPGRAEFCDATRLAAALVGDAVGANLFLVGYAWQRGLIPLGLEALSQAIEMNGVAIPLNKAAFSWGRRAALDLDAVLRAADGAPAGGQGLSTTYEEMLARRIAFLTDYQDKAYAARFEAVVREVEAAEQKAAPGSTRLAAAAAQSLFRLMAYKDEYEVARLYTDTGFFKKIAAEYEGGYRLNFHLAPPAFAQTDPKTGELKKQKFGPWMRTAFAVLAKGKGLRGSALDPFGHTAERRAERRLIEDYIGLVKGDLLPALTAANLDRAVAVAEAAQAIKGYGHVKARNMFIAADQQRDRLAAFKASPGAVAA